VIITQIIIALALLLATLRRDQRNGTQTAPPGL